MLFNLAEIIHQNVNNLLRADTARKKIPLNLALLLYDYVFMKAPYVRGIEEGKKAGKENYCFLCLVVS